MQKRYHTLENIIFDAIVYLVMAFVLICCLVPFIYMLAVSFSGTKPLINGEVFLWPKDFTLDSYKQIFTYPNFFKAYGNTFLYAVGGTAIALIMTSLMAYPLSKTFLWGNKFFTKMVVVTMFFSGGLIPNYLLLNSLHLVGTRAAMLMPFAINSFNLIILINFFRSIPNEIEEAALIDGLGYFGILRRIVLPVQHLNEGMERLQQGDFTHKLPPEGHLEMRQLLQRYNDTGDRMQALIEENRLREEQRYAEELKALQSEINPHFLLNTVNTIRFMADLARFDSIRDMAADLMEILRCLLRTPAERYTLADEAKILEAYIHIMEVRYSGSFSFRCAFSPESLACRLPKLLLQPLVENALLHGLEGCEDGEVSLSGRTEDGVLYLSVCDNGVGMDPERLAACLSGPGEGKAGSSIGLANVQRRILLQYGAPYGLWVDSAPGRGTCISITLPAGSGREGGLPCCAQ